MFIQEIHMPEYTNNSLVKIYISYANSVVRDNHAKGKSHATNRARLEGDIIRLIHEATSPLEFKIACTSMILHTDMFDIFWIGLKDQYELDDDCIARRQPIWSFVNAVQPPLRDPSPRLGESSAETETVGSVRSVGPGSDREDGPTVAIPSRRTPSPCPSSSDWSTPSSHGSWLVDNKLLPRAKWEDPKMKLAPLVDNGKKSPKPRPEKTKHFTGVFATSIDNPEDFDAFYRYKPVFPTGPTFPAMPPPPPVPRGQKKSGGPATKKRKGPEDEPEASTKKRKTADTELAASSDQITEARPEPSKDATAGKGKAKAKAKAKARGKGKGKGKGRAPTPSASVEEPDGDGNPPVDNDGTVDGGQVEVPSRPPQPRPTTGGKSVGPVEPPQPRETKRKAADGVEGEKKSKRRKGV